MEIKKYPLKLKPIFKEIIWGGNKLKTEYGKVCDFEKLAESWELTVRHDGMNIIENGAHAGMTLEAYLEAIGHTEKFPLLIKLIDARDKLSIQVHPNDEYAQKNEGEFGKTEVWYIVDADEGAELVFGLRGGFDKEAFRQALTEGTVEKYMNYVKVKPGDVYFIPSGLVHAIGAGILIAEIQQSSNVTYRVYDYMRRQKDGSLRELHVDKALDVIVDYSEEEIKKLQFAKADEVPTAKDSTLIAACDYFKVVKFDTTSEVTLSADSSFIHVLCLDGEGSIDGEPIKKGDSYFIPAGTGKVSVVANARLSFIASSV